MRWLDLAHELTRHSTAKQQRMAAVVVRGGAVVSTGVNLGFKHAETRALRPHMDLSGAVVYVMRHNRLCSRPCDDCQAKAIRAGIRKAVYVSKDGTVVAEPYR